MKALLVLLLCFTLQAFGQEAQSSSGHDHHSSGTVETRGDTAMGFSHEKTAYHFRLYSDGGAIEVTADDPSDSSDITAIRTHLKHIAEMFSAGDFSAPMLIHDRFPAGVPELKLAKSAVLYRFEEIPSGAKVRIQTSDEKSLKAVHEFLRFQIADHHTGDTTTTSSPGQKE
jgi:TusA-related sulfurtransferase